MVTEIYSHAGLVIQPYQLKLIHEDAMRVIINKARAVGLTQILALKVVLLAMLIKCEYIIISQDRDSANKVIKYVKEFYTIIKEKINFDFGVYRFGDGAKSEICFSNGSVIKSYSSKADAVRSSHGFVLWDEAAYHPEDEKLKRAISGCLKPAFPWYVFSTPNEMTGVYYNLWEKAKTRADGGMWEKYLIPYTECNHPKYQASVLAERAEAEEQGLLDDWLQEYCNKFIDGTTRLFNMELINSSKEKGPAIDVPVRSVGIDFGKDVAHSELVGAGKDDTGRIRFPLMIGYLLKQKYETQVESMISNLITLTDNEGIYIDGTGVGNDIKERFDASPVAHLIKPLIYTTALKEKMIMYFYTGLNAGRILIPNDKKFIKQLHGLRRTTLDSGAVRYKHESGVKDDRVWAAVSATKHFMDDEMFASENMPISVGRQEVDCNNEKLSKLKEEMERNRL
jgi:phage FluMu gp28-like protein